MWRRHHGEQRLLLAPLQRLLLHRWRPGRVRLARRQSLGRVHGRGVMRGSILIDHLEWHATVEHPLERLHRRQRSTQHSQRLRDFRDRECTPHHSDRSIPWSRRKANPLPPQDRVEIECSAINCESSLWWWFLMSTQTVINRTPIQWVFRVGRSSSVVSTSLEVPLQHSTQQNHSLWEIRRLIHSRSFRWGS